MRFPVFGRSKFSREEMEEEAAAELRTALEAVPGPPDPRLASSELFAGQSVAPVAPVAASPAQVPAAPST